MTAFTAPVITGEDAELPATLPDEVPLSVAGATSSQYEVFSEARRFDLQTPEGGILNGLSRFAVREGIYTGKLHNTARIRKVDGSWEPLGSVSEFAAVFQLLGLEALPAPTTRKIAGWRGEKSREELPEVETKVVIAEAPKPASGGSGPLILIGAAALIAILLVGGVLLMISM
jgi:hypothetical protein